MCGSWGQKGPILYGLQVVVLSCCFKSHKNSVPNSWITKSQTLIPTWLQSDKAKSWLPIPAHVISLVFVTCPRIIQDHSPSAPEENQTHSRPSPSQWPK